MANLTREDILKLANLSQITIDEHEAEQLAQDITAVLSYAEYLSKRAAALSTEGSLSMEDNRFREDRSRSGNKEILLSAAPQSDGNYFIVPRVLKGS